MTTVSSTLKPSAVAVDIPAATARGTSDAFIAWPSALRLAEANRKGAFGGPKNREHVAPVGPSQPVAALKEADGLVKSDIPFVIANDGAGVAAKFGVTGKFAIAIIGPDGNIDYQTDKILPGGRVRDVIQNSFTMQINARKH